MIIYIVRYTLKGNDRRLDLKPAHLNHLQKYYNSGELLAAGIFTDKVGGYLLFGTNSVEETEDILQKDPYIINGVREYQIDTWDMSPFPFKGL